MIKLRTRHARAVSLIGLLLIVHVAAANIELPGTWPEHPTALIGGTLHTVENGVVENGVLLISGREIVALGILEAVSIPDDAQRVDITGQHVYPGLIDAITAIGLVEIGAVRATRDQNETGTINPNARAIIAFNPDSEVIPVTRAGGVLLANSVPRGGLISGISALMMLDGWTAEDMALRPAVAMHVHWPMPPRRSWSERRSLRQQRAQQDEQQSTLRDTFNDARAYQVTRKANPRAAFDPRLDALVPVLENELALFAHANDVRQIQEAVAFAAREKIRLVVVGGYDAVSCAELLKQHEVPVIVTGTHRLPRRRHDSVDAAFALPKRLHEMGVRFCLAGMGSSSASNVRNLADHAGTAAAYGLEPAAAVRAMTLDAAEILGVGDRVGSLRVGKDATVIVADGDILEVTTEVRSAYLQGRPVDLNNRHKRLWRKYARKYEPAASQP